MASHAKPSSSRRETEFPRPVPPGLDDLVILVRDADEPLGVFYLLQKATYHQDHDVESSMVGQAQVLVEQGVVLADIPVGSIPGVGAMCYLVNLSGFKPREPRPDNGGTTNGRPVITPPPLDKDDPCLVEPAPAFDDLVIADRTGAKFYWVKKCEYQREACRLDRLEPILEEQLRLLTNQGVVIADVPGGILPGVDDMGCLVNLKAIQRDAAKATMAQRHLASSSLRV